VRAVSEKMDQLAACTTNKPKAEVLDEYRQKVEHLKSLVDLDRLVRQERLQFVYAIDPA